MKAASGINSRGNKLALPLNVVTDCKNPVDYHSKRKEEFFFFSTGHCSETHNDIMKIPFLSLVSSIKKKGASEERKFHFSIET